MLKHIGRHGDRKVAVIFREVPGEDHMALITYSDVLPRMVHDELMKCVEGVVAQNTKDVADCQYAITWHPFLYSTISISVSKRIVVRLECNFLM